MELKRLTDRVWYYPYEEARDRPNLGYIRGDRWALAVDAGHSADHTGAFYRALEAAGLPLPDLTVLTHWHWDHTFGMHAVHGLCIANARTKAHLAAFRQKLDREGRAMFLAMHGSIALEYAGDRPVTVTLPDLVFEDRLEIDLGNCPVTLFTAEAPHTDDSTLVLAPGEDVLFVGDAEGGVFPTWEKNPILCGKFADTLAATGVRWVLEGHWTPAPTEELVRELRADAAQA